MAIVELWLLGMLICAVFGAGMGLVAYAAMQIGRTLWQLARHELSLAWWAVANRRELARDSAAALAAFDHHVVRVMASIYLGGLR